MHAKKKRHEVPQIECVQCVKWEDEPSEHLKLKNEEKK